LGIDIRKEADDVCSTFRDVQGHNYVFDSRVIPLHAVVTGVGRGKTRYLVELQEELNQRPKVLCVAITFNNMWEQIFFPPTLGNNPTPEDISMIYAVNIVARIFSMQFRLEVTDAYKLIQNVFLVNPGENLKSPISLIQDCVRYVVERSAASIHGNGTIKRFVLLADESKKVQDELQMRSSTPISVHDVLREAILTLPMLSSDGSVLETNLVMSCLDVNALGAKDSGRVIISLVLPNALNSTDIWDKWASVYLPAEFVSQINAKMDFRQIVILLFATLASLPRAVEHSIFELERAWQIKELAMEKKLSPSAIRGILSSAMSAVNLRFSGMIANADLSPNVMRAILFSKRIGLLVDKSVLTVTRDHAALEGLTFVGLFVSRCLVGRDGEYAMVEERANEQLAQNEESEESSQLNACVHPIEM